MLSATGSIGSAGPTGSVGPVGATGPQGIQTKNHHQFPVVKKIADNLQLTIEKFKEISRVDMYPNYTYNPEDPTPWTLKFNFVKKDFIPIINGHCYTGATELMLYEKRIIKSLEDKFIEKSNIVFGDMSLKIVIYPNEYVESQREDKINKILEYQI
jgi:hypothetical protein